MTEAVELWLFLAFVGLVSAAIRAVIVRGR